MVTTAGNADRPKGILDYGCMMTRHTRMSGDVWTWAARQRRRKTNIGVEWTNIT